MKKAHIYTTKGDCGETSLLHGERVPKDSIRVEAYGTVDELSAVLGFLQAETEGNDCSAMLAEVQNNLFAIAATLSDTACPEAAIGTEAVKALERAIDSLEETLPPLKGFALPSPVGASLWANLCRTVCRRAERRIVTLAHSENIPPKLTEYMNRLSDYFFLLSRQLASGNEKIWKSPCK
ncbi:MAG: cob(I)yrinic acid a,c-diamide adenosyltransferase [Bacteroidaceae bacterium]|nr:cob(I)yrinic acid a,c-diamide adenosyltransferase [Bacteroidaceae bacterium]